MATLIYTEMAGDKLKLLAEVGEDNVELAVDALLDAEPKFSSQQPFVCFSTDSRIVVEAEEEVIQPRRRMKLNGASSGGAATAKKPRQTRARKPVEQVEEAEVETAPEPATKAKAKPVTTKKPAAKKSPVAAKPKAAAKPAAKKTPFSRNAKSDE